MIIIYCLKIIRLALVEAIPSDIEVPQATELGAVNGQT